MSKRRASDEERAQFEAAFVEARALKIDVPTRARAKSLPPSQIVARAPSGLDGRTSERLRRGAIEPDARLDLHGMTQTAAHRALLLFLRDAQRSGVKLALVVTGKGAPASDEVFEMERSRGVLKEMVPRWLKEPAFAGMLAGTRTAHRRHGGVGALYLYLCKTGGR